MIHLSNMFTPILCIDMLTGVLSLQVELFVKQCLINVVQLCIFQVRVPEYPTVRPDGSLWRYGYVKPIEEYLQVLKDAAPLSVEDSSASDWSDESDSASTEACRDSKEDLTIELAGDIDPNNNIVLVNGPDPADEADEESLGSSPDCSLE